MGHSCGSKQCETWKAEREICEIKVEQDVSYAHARRLYEKEGQNPSPTVLSYVTVARSTSDGEQRDTALREMVEKVECKLDKVMEHLEKLLLSQTQALIGQVSKPGCSTSYPQCFLTSQTRMSSGLSGTGSSPAFISPGTATITQRP